MYCNCHRQWTWWSLVLAASCYGCLFFFFKDLTIVSNLFFCQCCLKKLKCMPHCFKWACVWNVLVSFPYKLFLNGVNSIGFKANHFKYLSLCIGKLNSSFFPFNFLILNSKQELSSEWIILVLNCTSGLIALSWEKVGESTQRTVNLWFPLLILRQIKCQTANMAHISFYELLI